MDPLWKQFYSLREEPLQDLLEPFSWRNLTR